MPGHGNGTVSSVDIESEANFLGVARCAEELVSFHGPYAPLSPTVLRGRPYYPANVEDEG